jgi:hypothetical protein
MSDTQPQPNSRTTGDDEAERTVSGSVGKEHEHLYNEQDCPESEKEWHGRISPDDQDDDNRCI